MKPLRIMIVDDQQLFAEGLRHVVEGESRGSIAVLGIAHNGEEAIQMARELKPEVILMDIRMPVMDGNRATGIIHEEHPDIHIMILTTFDDDDLVFDALCAGANGYILKNTEPHDLVLAIEAVRTGALYVSPSVGYKLVDKGKPDAAAPARSLVRTIIARLPVLTIREAEIVDQILQARRNAEIAEHLNISEKTVRNHISTIYDKLGIHNRLRLMSYMSEQGIGSAENV